MSQSTTYANWKPSVLGKHVDIDKSYGAQCVDVVLDIGEAYFLGIAWSTLFPPVSSAKLLGSKHNDKYFEWVPNDHNDPNQLPETGDIMVFDATPASGYTNTFENPDGHCGVCDHATSAGYWLLQQNAPATGAAVNVTYYPWKYRPCLGWLRPRLSTTASPAPAPTAKPDNGKTLYLPQSVQKWRVYSVQGPWTVGHEVAYLWPSKFKGGLSYKILATLASGVYEIQTEDFGKVAIYTGVPGKDTDAVIK